MADNTPFLIINPNSNNGKTSKEINDILSVAKKVLGDFSYDLTTKMGDGVVLANKAKKEGYKTIVAIGGDGKNPIRMDNPSMPFLSNVRFGNTHFWKYHDYGKNLEYRNTSGAIADFTL